MIVLLHSCYSNDFYSYSRIEDVYRVPLINPYEVKSYNHGNDWFIELNDSTIRFTSQFENINSIGLKDSLIVAYSPRLFLPRLGEMTEAWVVINAKSKKENVFSNELEYEMFLKKSDMPKFQLKNIDTLFMKFDNSKELPIEWDHLKSN